MVLIWVRTMLQVDEMSKPRLTLDTALVAEASSSSKGIEQVSDSLSVCLTHVGWTEKRV